MTPVALPYRPPYDWDSLLGYLAARAIPGMERVEGGAYSRSVPDGFFTVRHEPHERRLLADVRAPDGPAVATRLARVFDTERDIGEVARHFESDPVLGPLLLRRPGLRVPGAWDGFELAVRAVLGQQVSVAAARGLALRLVVLCGRTAPDNPDGLQLVFPDATTMAKADLGAMGMPGPRRATLRALAEAACADPALFEPAQTLAASVAKLRRIRGIGDWTAHYIALRALRHMDAFPHADLALLRAVAGAGRVRPAPRVLLAQAEAWRPWRAYAAQHLWAADPMQPGA